MKSSEKSAFADLLTDAMAFYRQSLSPFALSVWWQACEGYELEQVTKAITKHAMDPDRGQFPPKPADLVRMLQGTNSDRSLIAWGKTLDAMQRVGAYTSVCFDDPAIHAAIEDMGGWSKLCRSELDDMPHVQRRFCETYRAYAGRGNFSYPARLPGQFEQQNAVTGHRTAPPALIGDPSRAQAVGNAGSLLPKTQITHIGDALAIKRLGVDAA